ncbi:ribonuclease H-like YkuK family protein, partial [Chryseobacterium sp.]|uniref:ribonuclease H-like YkuK family protein n=1 Tax=Chryseobacterium sp. TaxID=1871047 RepID=UPI002FC5D581
YSIEVAMAIRESGVNVKFIDIDINGNPKYKSNKVLEQAMGMVKGMGFDVRHKQSGAIATYAANHLVRL